MLRSKILVVDQDAQPYESLEPGLSVHGYEMHMTATPPEALSLARAHDYKAALVSVALTPDGTFLTDLQKELPNLPLILICTAEGRCVPASLFNMAYNAMEKPLTLEPVRLMLDRALELAILRHRLRQQRTGCNQKLVARSPEASSEVSEFSAVSLDNLLTQRLQAMVSSMEALGRGSLHRAVLSHVEKLLLTIVLTECRGNQLKSAEILGINRNTLRKKLRDFGVTFPRRST